MLNLKFDRRKNKSLPQQLLETMQMEITHHRHGAHSVLPDLDEFAKKYQIKFEEAKWIYDQLLLTKLVVLKDKQYIISEFEIPSIFFNRIHSITQIIRANHYQPSQKDVSMEIVDCPQGILEKYPMNQSKYYKIERIFYGDERPLMLANVYYSLDRYEGIDRLDLKDKELWPIILEHFDFDVANANVRFQARKLSKLQIEQLETNQSFANYIEILIYNRKNELIEYTEVFANADEFSFRFDINL